MSENRRFWCRNRVCLVIPRVIPLPCALVVNQERKAEYHPLVLERAIEDKWLVTKGLASGDKVIVEGRLMLRPGTGWCRPHRSRKKPLEKKEVEG